MPRPLKEKCSNCRRLRIKCDCTRPSCEYCRARGRVCEYPKRQPPSLKWAQKTKEQIKIEEANGIARSNSTSSHSSSKSTDSQTSPPIVSPQSDRSSTTSLAVSSAVSSPTYSKLNSPTSLTGASDFEVFLYGEFLKWWNDTYRMEWKTKFKIIKYRHGLFNMFFEHDLAKFSILAYQGLRFLTEKGQYSHETGNKSLQHVYTSTVTWFGMQCRLMGEVVARIHKGQPSYTDLVLIRLVMPIMMDYLACHPDSDSPLVNFKGRKNDFVGFIRCSIIVGRLSNTYATLEENSYWYEPSKFSPREILPVKIPFLAKVAEFAPKEAVWMHCIGILNALVQECVGEGSRFALRRFLYYPFPAFFDMVYDQVPMALSIINIYCAYYAMTGYYAHRNSNLWINHMRWHASFCDGHWMAPWERDLYELVVEKGYTFPNITSVWNFDPFNINSSIGSTKVYSSPRND
ncbi:hypothetical protein DICA0_B00408 [Diutina catenulata]